MTFQIALIRAYRLIFSHDMPTALYTAGDATTISGSPDWKSIPSAHPALV
jgi:hypothetical protein